MMATTMRGSHSVLHDEIRLILFESVTCKLEMDTVKELEEMKKKKKPTSQIQIMSIIELISYSNINFLV